MYSRLQWNPRELGVRFRMEDMEREHWVYESPMIPGRARLRLYYTISGDIVSLEAVGLL